MRGALFCLLLRDEARQGLGPAALQEAVKALPKRERAIQASEGEKGAGLPRSRCESLLHSVYLIVVQVIEKPRFANAAAVRSFCQERSVHRRVGR